MPDTPNRSDELEQILQHVIVVGFDVVVGAAVNRDQLVAQALKDKKVKEAIDAELLRVSQELLKNSSTQPTSEGSKKLATAFLDKSFDALGPGVLDQIKKSPEFKRLESTTKRLEAAFNATPVGAWLDKNDTILYISAAILVLGGTTALYISRSGDDVTKYVMPIAKGIRKKVTILGKLDLAVGVSKFVPSKREFQLDLDAFAKWRAVKTEFKFAAHAVETKVGVSGTAKIVLPQSDFAARVEGSYDPHDPKKAPVTLGLGFELKPGGVRLDLLGKIYLRDDGVSGGAVDVKMGPSRKLPMKVGVQGATERQSGTSLLGTVSFDF